MVNEKMKKFVENFKILNEKVRENQLVLTSFVDI